MSVWLEINGWPGYAVSDDGQVMRTVGGRGTRAGTILRGGVGSHGYRTVTLCYKNVKKVFLVHALVLEAFKGQRPHPSAEALHRDGDKLNNSDANLEWGTQSRNNLDRELHGGGIRGEKHHLTRLTESDVLAIRSKYIRKVVTCRMLGDEFDVSEECVRQIVQRETWAHL